MANEFGMRWHFNMVGLTPEQHLQIVQIYFENHSSVRATYRALRRFYGAHDPPSEQLIRETMDRFRTTFTLNDNVHPARRRTVRTQQMIDVVRQSVEDDANVSIRRRAQQLNMCPSTLWNILQKRSMVSLISCSEGRS